MRLVCVVALVLVGCGTKPNPASCIDNHCSDPDLPFCDVDGSIGGEPNTCIAVTCTPGEFEACRGDRALTCNTAGDNYELVECQYGCSAEANGCKACDAPECEKHIIPKYVPDACNQLTTAGALSISASTTFDTGNALNCTTTITQVDGPEICVLRHGTINIDRNQTLTVIGSRALALVADRDISIDGEIDARARFDGVSNNNGPGGGTRKSGTSVNVAGGGAGYRTAGGSGGTTTNGGAANGGAVGPSPASSTVLLGGAQPVAAANGGLPGGGGGALTLISCRGKVSVSGLVDVNGGGGGAGRLTNFGQVYRMAAGGGSGGTVVLQGMSVVVTGQLFANGGGGGGGGNFDAGNGSGGLRSTQPAPGGLGAAAPSMNGGFGGSATIPPGDGNGSGGDPAYGGAGGGSTGYLATYTPQGVMPTLTPVTVSPPFETNGTIPTN